MYRIVYRSEANRLDVCSVPNLDPLRRAQPADRWVRLPNQARIRPSWVVSVARYEADRVVSAWLVSQYGLDGESPHGRQRVASKP